MIQRILALAVVTTFWLLARWRRSAQFVSLRHTPIALGQRARSWRSFVITRDAMFSASLFRWSTMPVSRTAVQTMYGNLLAKRIVTAYQ